MKSSPRSKSYQLGLSIAKSEYDLTYDEARG